MLLINVTMIKKKLYVFDVLINVTMIKQKLYVVDGSIERSFIGKI